MRRTLPLATARCALFVSLSLSGGDALAAKKAPAPPSRGERLVRLLELEDTRQAGPRLLELLHDPDRQIRRRAALAAGRIGSIDAAPALRQLLADPEPEIRRTAAFALGLIGDRGSVDRLLASLGDADAGLRAEAARALGRIGDARAAAPLAKLVVSTLPSTISRMAVRGDDPGSAGDGWAEQRSALFALAALGDRAAAAHALLANGSPRFDWWAATWVAMRLEDPALRPVLEAALASDDARSRALGARGLGALKDASAVEPLLRLVRDADAGVAVAALRALAAIGDPRGTAVAASMIASASDTVRREALLALAQLPADPLLRPRLVALVADSNPWVRGAAFGALAHTSPEDFALVLSGLDADPDFRVRQALATALGRQRHELSVGVLQGMLSDPDPRVLPAVLEGLRRAGAGDAAEQLQRHLDHADAGVRATAAEQLAELGPRGLAAPLLTAWQRGVTDDAGELEPRLAAVEALAAQRDEPGRAALARIAAEDPARAVRARAAGALDAQGGRAPDPGPERVSRPWLDYREAAAPFEPRSGVSVFTPRAFLRTAKGTIELHLDRIDTPLTTASFLSLARRGFYDGLSFHRVEPGFVVQGGCPRGDGYGGPGYALRCELSRAPYARGSVGMALAGKDTGGSQFFISLGPQPHLDGRYTLFARVAAGMDVVEALRPGDTIERVDVWTGE